MKRREFIAGLGGAVAWPLAARAQQQPLPVVGVLQEGRDWLPGLKAAFIQGLTETGYAEDRDVVIEERFSGDAARLREMAADLVRRRVAVIAAPGNTLAALAAKAATNTIPIIFSVGVDPVQTGLVRSLNHPGANLTGYTEVNTEVWSKRLELLWALAPTTARFWCARLSGEPAQ
jgi:putative tryptophan/tyrosine transport system substrate-binding protein